MQLYTYMQKLPNRVHTGMLHIWVCVGQQACNSLMVPISVHIMRVGMRKFQRVNVCGLLSLQSYYSKQMIMYYVEDTPLLL